ncbi:MAG TPA: hypothetical protein VF898_06945 [Chloroflexota bacterium]
MAAARDLQDIDEAHRHCQAGLKAIESASRAARETGEIYPTHLHLAAVELAHAIELALKVALRNQ